MSSLTLSDRQAIVSLCKLHDESPIRGPHFRKCVVFKSWFVKYGSHRSLKFRRETQEYIYNMAVDDPSAPRVPKVVDYFTVEEQTAYLIMEFIDAATPADSAYEKVAAALQWLRSAPVLADAKIGSVGGGRARHKLFKDFKAPLLFTSAEALQNYMNTALRWVPGPRKPANVSFGNDRLVFTQSNMDKSNFFIDQNDKICILDSEDVVLLPESFASYTINVSYDPFVKGVAGYLKWARSPNEDSMKVVGRI